MANFNLNKVILGGRLTADIEQKQTPNGVAVCNFSIAVNRKYSRENEQQTADFINCQAWRGTAEFISKYFRKGSAICVIGSIQTRSWKDNSGNTRYATEVIVDEALFVDGKNDSQSAETANPNTYIPDAYMPSQTADTADEDDDLPF
jgi:single-strand DNA-binding protein